MGASYEGIDIGVLRISCTVTMTQKSSLSRESIKQQAGGHGASVDTLFSPGHGLSENLFPCCIALYSRRYRIIRGRQILETTG